MSLPLRQAARIVEAQLMRSIAERTQTRIADLLSIDDSTFNRWITSDAGLRRCAELLAALGMRVKPVGDPDYSPAYVEALETLTMHQLEQKRTERPT